MRYLGEGAYRISGCLAGTARVAAAVALCLVAAGVADASKKSYRYEDDPVRLGMRAIEEGDLVKAERQFNEAIENEHQVYKARYGLAELHYLRTQYAEAEPLYRQALIEKNKETGSEDYPEARAGLGLVLLKLGRIAEAEQVFEHALREKGNLWEANYGMARVSLAAGNLREAEKYLERGKKNSGAKEKEDLYRYGMAILQREQGEIEAAEKNALAALHINPNDSDYGTLVGEIYTARGSAPLAITAYEKVLDMAGPRVRAPIHHQLGVLYQKEKRYEQALSQYETAVDKDSTFAPAWKSRSELLAVARGRERDAAASYLRYTELRPDDPAGFLGLAEVALKANLTRPALEAAQQAFALDSTSVDIRLALARAAFLNNDREAADRQYRSLPDTVRFDAVDYVRMGQLQLDRREFDAASNNLRRAIDMDSTQADAYFALGLLFLNRGEQDSSRVQFEKALVVQPGHAGASLNLGITYLQLKQPQSAIAPLRSAVASAPSYTAARTYLALALVNADSLSAAVVEYRRALEQEPRNPGALRGLGFCYLKRGDNLQAVKVLKEAAEVDAGNAEGWVMLGQAQALSGNNAAAIGSFEKAISINPDHATAKKGLETLRATQGQ